MAVPDPRWQEVPLAVLVAGEGQTIGVDVVRDYCRERMAKFKVPRYFVVEPELPRTPSGKVKKFELRDQYQSLGSSA